MEEQCPGSDVILVYIKKNIVNGIDLYILHTCFVTITRLHYFELKQHFRLHFTDVIFLCLRLYHRVLVTRHFLFFTVHNQILKLRDSHFLVLVKWKLRTSNDIRVKSLCDCIISTSTNMKFLVTVYKGN